MSQFYTIASVCASELRVKDSRFIAWLTPAAMREQAEELIAERSRQFHDARHNCYALRVGCDARLIALASDAQEPSGSAGRPMLQALESHQLTNIAAVVTRYFGGTKLGVGGLMRAYSSAVQAAIAQATLLPIFATRRFELHYAYQLSGIVDRVLHQFDAEIIKSEFGIEVNREIEIRAERTPEFNLVLNELSAGRVQCKLVE